MWQQAISDSLDSFYSIVYIFFQVDIRVVGIEINHLGEVFEGNIDQLDELMFKNGYEYFGNVKIDNFYVKKTNSKKKSQRNKTNNF